MRQVDDSNSIGPFLAFCGVAILLLICTLEVLRPNKLSIPIQIKNNKALCFFSKTCLKVDASNGVLITEGLKVNLRIINFHNLFDLKKDLERVSFYLLKKGNNNVDKNSVQIRPVIKYRGYTNSQEIAGSITGYFILPLKIPYDYEIFYKIDDAQPKSLSVMSTTRGTWFGKILPKLHKRLVTIFSKLSLLTSLLLFFVLAVSTFLEWRKNQVDDTTSNFFITSILRPVFLILFISINFLSIKILNKSFPQYEFGEIWSVGLLLLFVMPWGIWLPKDLKFQWIKNFFSTLFRSFPTYKNSSSHQNDLDDSCSLPPWLNNILSLFTALMILLFAYWMFLDNSFRWSLFEERDLLNTRDFLQTGRIPILGPQLLAGGQTPGGALYFLLAPLLLIQDDPITFSIFTKILYLFSALLIWLILRRFVSKLSALVGLILFCTSQNVMIYSYWPIHPSMSVFFYLFFVYAFSRGIVDQQRRWFIFSAFLLAILAQLHFSYVMLVVSLIMGIRAFKFFKRSFVFFLSVFAAFLLSFIPYLIVEITQGFPNFSLILSSPRFQPSYVAYSPFQNLAMVGESLAWIDRWHWPINDWRSALHYGFIGANLAALILLAIGWLVVLEGMPVKTHPLKDLEFKRFGMVLALLVFPPVLILMITGLGYNIRHTISFGPTLFLVCSFGLEWILRKSSQFSYFLSKIFFNVVAFIFLGAMLTWGGLIFIDGEDWIKNGPKAGEWAVDYKTRQKVAKYLIQEMGISKEFYSKKVYWWWYGYSISPEIFKDEINRYSQQRQQHVLNFPSKDDYVLLLSDQKQERHFFERWFELEHIKEIEPITVFKAKPKTTVSLIGPQANTINVARLNPLQKTLENILLPSLDGLFRIGIKSNSRWKNPQGYLLSVAKGKIRLLWVLEEELRKSSKVLKWGIFSPSLNGYYQEIKTLWKPEIGFKGARESQNERFVILDGVLGSLLFKTPYLGEIPINKTSDSVYLTVSGYFDQSSMKMPILNDKIWLLEEALETDILLELD